MIEYQRLFHVGIRTPDVSASMSELGQTMNLTWASVREVEAQPLWTPTDDLHEVPLRFVYSCQGPQHIELLEGPAGSFWDGRDQPGVHHVGVWVDDVAGEVGRVTAAGWEVVAAMAAPEDGYGLFAYVAPPTGMLVELVSAAIEPGFQAWWSAGLAAAPATSSDT